MDTNDDEEDYFPTCQLIATDDEANDETEDIIDTSKPSHGTTSEIETDLPSPITAVPIVATKTPVFTSAKVPAILLSIYVPRKLSHISALTVVEKIVPVKITTR